MTKQELYRQAKELSAESLRQKKLTPCVYPSWTKPHIQAFIGQFGSNKKMDIPRTVHNRRNKPEVRPL